MNENTNQVCPWCQTEIVWDPEIGPEEVCPHCLNELGDYRSVSLRIDGRDEEDPEDEADEAEDEVEAEEEDGDEDEAQAGAPQPGLHVHNRPGHAPPTPHGHVHAETDYDDYDENEQPDPYREKLSSLLDTQLEAPECPNCRELMLLGGQVRLSGNRFAPAHPSAVREPLLPEILEMDLYVCPSCFKTETYLAEPGRLRLTQTLGR
jgi:ribosomal protein L37AE/L43A